LHDSLARLLSLFGRTLAHLGCFGTRRVKNLFRFCISIVAGNSRLPRIF
jgi:hypothetical protein